MQPITIGDKQVGRLGLGCWPFSGVRPRPESVESIRVIHAALDAGMVLLDSADSYQLPGEEPGHSELLLAEALRTWGGPADRVLVATKGGRAVAEDGSRFCSAHPDRLKAACLVSRERLGVETIDLYYLHRPDPAVPFEDSVGALVELAEEGQIRWIGVSNVDADQIRLAKSVAGDRLVAVQNEFSPWFQSSADEIDVALELGLAFVAYAPFGGAAKSASLGDISVLAEIATAREATPHQVVLAWMLARRPNLVPIPATKTIERVRSLVEAALLELDPWEVRALDDAMVSA